MYVHSFRSSEPTDKALGRAVKLRIGVVGLGHVGIVTAAALLRDGHAVAGVESDTTILECVKEGRSPICEPEVDELIGEGHATKKLSVSSDIEDIISLDLAFVCVGTRGRPDGDLDLSDVMTVAREIGTAIRKRSTDLPPLLIAFRSTMLPGSMNQFVLPTIAIEAGEGPGLRYEIAYVPEFSREGSAVADHFDPARIVIGERRPGAAHLVQRIFSDFDVPTFFTIFETAELAKFADNTFHALKVAFANEIGRFALHAGASPSEVFNIFRADNKLNISSAYLSPGGPFGGPCLKKDSRALANRMHAAGIKAPVIDNVIASNERHGDFLLEEIAKRTQPPSRILLIGLSFKTHTDDLRDSPLVTLADAILKRGYELSIYDPDLALDRETSSLGAAKVPERFANILLSRIPTNTPTWDLMIVAKHPSKANALAARATSIFRIDRL